MVPTDGTLEVLSQLRVTGAMMRPVDRPWQVPYCADCQGHVNLAWNAGGKFFRRTALPVIFIMLPFLPFEIIRWVALVLGGSTIAVLYAIARIRMRVVKPGPRCAAPTLAVKRKGPEGARYSIGFLNAEYAKAFEQHQGQADAPAPGARS